VWGDVVQVYDVPDETCLPVIQDREKGLTQIPLEQIGLSLLDLGIASPVAYLPFDVGKAGRLDCKENLMFVVFDCTSKNFIRSTRDV